MVLTGIDTSAVVVERLAIVVGFGAELAASLVTCHTCVTIESSGQDTTRAVILRECTAWSRVQRGLVLGVPVHALENVDLAFVGPSVTAGPERGPGATAIWHVYGVEDDETTVERIFRVDAH